MNRVNFTQTVKCCMESFCQDTLCPVNKAVSHCIRKPSKCHFSLYIPTVFHHCYFFISGKIRC